MQWSPTCKMILGMEKNSQKKTDGATHVMQNVTLRIDYWITE